MNLKRFYMLSIFNFLSFFAFALLTTQLIPYMKYLKYDLVQQGYILAISAIIAIFGQFLFGYLCDRYQSLKKFYYLSYFIVLLSAIGMFLFQKNYFIYHLIMISLMMGMVKVVIALNETWMQQMDHHHYGKIRAAGAIGLTLGAFFTGIFITKFNFQNILFVFLFLSLLLLFIIHAIPDIKQQTKTKITYAHLKVLITNKDYFLLVSIYLLLYMVGTADQYVVIDKMVEIGANTSVIGFKWAVQSLMEIPVLIGSHYLLKKVSLFTLLKIATVMYSVKFILYGLSTTTFMIIASASLQLVTLPIIMITSKILISKVTTKEYQTSAHMFAMAIFIGFSGFITPLITTRLCKAYGSNITLFIVASFCIFPYRLIRYFQKTCEKK
ncbi:MAG: MFS transporter [Erysipelotrichaceae bacterium]